MFVARINPLRTGPETIRWVWSQQAGTRGSRAAQEGEGGGARQELETAGVWVRSCLGPQWGGQ